MKLTMQGGLTALYIACTDGHLAIAQKLIKAGANVHHATESGWTCLFAACQSGHLPIVHLLCQNRVNINQPRHVKSFVFVMHAIPFVIFVNRTAARQFGLRVPKAMSPLSSFSLKLVSTSIRLSR